MVSSAETSGGRLVEVKGGFKVDLLVLVFLYSLAPV